MLSGCSLHLFCGIITCVCPGLVSARLVGRVGHATGQSTAVTVSSLHDKAAASCLDWECGCWLLYVLHGCYDDKSCRSALGPDDTNYHIHRI